MSIDYCTKDDLIRFLSLEGVQAFSDVDGDGLEDDDVIQECIERASDEISGVIYPLYDLAKAATSRLVKHWCVVMATAYLCERRGNSVPASIGVEYDRICDQTSGLLARVASKKFVLPEIPQRTVNVPAFSNLIVDRRHRRDKVRVIPVISSQLAPTKIKQSSLREASID